MKPTEIKKTPSSREMIANRIARFINVNKLNSPFGGDVSLYRGGKVPSYIVAFSIPRYLDGTVQVYSPTFILVRFNTSFRTLPASDSRVFTSEPDAIKFLKLAFVDLKADEAMAIPTKGK